MKAIMMNYRTDFIYVNQYRFSKTWVFPQSPIPYSMYRYIVSGEAIFTIDGLEHKVKAGDVAYIPQGCQMSCEAIVPVDFISIRFVGSIQLSGVDILSKVFSLSPVTPGTVEVYGWFCKILEAAIGKNSYKIFEIRGCLDLITAYLAKNTSSPHSSLKAMEEIELNEPLSPSLNRTFRDTRIDHILDCITTYPNENYDCKTLCKMGNMSESSLRRLFKKQTGKTPTVFLYELRMTNVARRLLISDESISTIAYELGFEDANYFTRKFKQSFGVSPTQYRKQALNL